jgi:hypothetical protein
LLHPQRLCADERLVAPHRDHDDASSRIRPRSHVASYLRTRLRSLFQQPPGGSQYRAATFRAARYPLHQRLERRAVEQEPQSVSPARAGPGRLPAPQPHYTAEQRRPTAPADKFVRNVAHRHRLRHRWLNGHGGSRRQYRHGAVELRAKLRLNDNRSTQTSALDRGAVSRFRPDGQRISPGAWRRARWPTACPSR